ncbi:hypothetical protein GGH94_002277 [Coemansia aciculifera]|uniref:PHD-type domain-containing protein n=1 Tax=Coemansia aciculifera TaxID=417176 RepID=A0A9W8IK44_9FUNG|nr:hypothetical protein GGH94_002277 [Coemansia aciculifera]
MSTDSDRRDAQPPPPRRPATPQQPLNRPATPQQSSSRPTTPQQPPSRPVMPQQPPSRPITPHLPTNRPAMPQQPPNRYGMPQQHHNRPIVPPNRYGMPQQHPNRPVMSRPPLNRPGMARPPFIRPTGMAQRPPAAQSSAAFSPRPSPTMPGASTPPVTSPSTMQATGAPTPRPRIDLATAASAASTPGRQAELAISKSNPSLPQRPSAAGSTNQVPRSHKAKPTEPSTPTAQSATDSAKSGGDDSMNEDNKDVESIDDDDDDDEICAVCLSGDYTSDNQIVICEGKCKLSFHQRCYGIAEIPPGDLPWKCDWCAGGSRTTFGKNLYCCHYKNDKAARSLNIAGKENEQHYVHIQCAAWNPEVDTSHLPFTTALGKIRASWSKCLFCHSRFGYQLHCAHVENDEPCESAFHPMCAFRHGFLPPPSDYNAKYSICYCPEHTTDANASATADTAVSVESRRIAANHEAELASSLARRNTLPGLSSSEGLPDFDAKAESVRLSTDQAWPSRRKYRTSRVIARETPSSVTQSASVVRRAGRLPLSLDDEFSDTARSEIPPDAASASNTPVTRSSKRRGRQSRNPMYMEVDSNSEAETSRRASTSAPDISPIEEEESVISSGRVKVIPFARSSNRRDSLIRDTSATLPRVNKPSSGAPSVEQGDKPSSVGPKLRLSLGRAAKTASVSNEQPSAPEATSESVASETMLPPTKSTIEPPPPLVGSTTEPSSHAESVAAPSSTTGSVVAPPSPAGSVAAQSPLEESATAPPPPAASIVAPSSLVESAVALPLSTGPVTAQPSLVGSTTTPLSLARSVVAQQLSTGSVVAPPPLAGSITAQPTSQPSSLGDQISPYAAFVKRPNIRLKPFSQTSSMSPTAGVSPGAHSYSAGNRGYGPPMASASNYSRPSPAAALSDDQANMLKESHAMLQKQNEMLGNICDMIKGLSVSPAQRTQEAMSTLSSLSSLVSNGQTSYLAPGNGIPPPGAPKTPLMTLPPQQIPPRHPHVPPMSPHAHAQYRMPVSGTFPAQPLSQPLPSAHSLHLSQTTAPFKLPWTAPPQHGQPQPPPPPGQPLRPSSPPLAEQPPLPQANRCFTFKTIMPSPGPRQIAPWVGAPGSSGVKRKRATPSNDHNSGSSGSGNGFLSQGNTRYKLDVASPSLSPIGPSALPVDPNRRSYSDGTNHLLREPADAIPDSIRRPYMRSTCIQAGSSMLDYANPIVDMDMEMDELKENIIYMIQGINMPQILLDMMTPSVSPDAANDASAQPENENWKVAFKLLMSELKKMGKLTKYNVADYVGILVDTLQAMKRIKQ